MLRGATFKHYSDFYKKNEKHCDICKEKFENKYVKDKKCCKLRNKFHYPMEKRGAAHSISNLKYSVPEKIPYSISKRCFSLWKYGWLGRTKWKVMTKKENFHGQLNIEDITDTD